jgi:mono/diheme cytochrome c family protein
MIKKLAVAVALAVLLFIAYQGLMYYDDNFPYGRMRETPAVKPHEAPLLVMEPGTVPVSGGDALLLAQDAKKLKAPFPLKAPEVILRGKAVYFTYCAQCHGNSHDGQGTVGQSFAPLPGDLRSTKVQRLGSGVIFKEISYGIPGGRQPALASTISIHGRWQVTAYVKSLGLRP